MNKEIIFAVGETLANGDVHFWNVFRGSPEDSNSRIIGVVDRWTGIPRFRLANNTDLTSVTEFNEVDLRRLQKFLNDFPKNPQ